MRNDGGSWGSLTVLPGYTTKSSIPPTLIVYVFGRYNEVLLYYEVHLCQVAYWFSDLNYFDTTQANYSGLTDTVIYDGL